jgi:hypothetical protein
MLLGRHRTWQTRNDQEVEMKRSRHLKGFRAVNAAIAGCGVLALLVAGCSGHGGHETDGGHEPAVAERGEVPADPGLPGYPFLTGTSDGDKAMTALYESGFEHADTQEEATALAAKKSQALAKIQANLPEVQRRLAETLGDLPPDAANAYLALMPLLAAAGDCPAVLEILARVMMAAPQTTVPAGAEDNPEDTVRWAVTTVVFHLAQRGSQAAKDGVLHAVQSEHPYARRLAVRYTYALHQNRNVAQSLMRRLLPCDQQHILYED